MILEALKRYYERANLAPLGWEYKEIPFIIVLDENGNFINIEDKTSREHPRGGLILVPQSEIRSGKNAWQHPNLLWDHYGFVLGQPKMKTDCRPDPSDSPEKAKNKLDAFVERIRLLKKSLPDSIEVSAVLRFYETQEYLKVLEDSKASDIFRLAGANITFALVGQVEPILHTPALVDWINNHADNNESDSSDEDEQQTMKATCLITGKMEEIARLHPKIKGVSQRPVALASANTGALPSVSSYGKSQGYNFPVGKSSAFAYATGLNHLLARDSNQRLKVGDTFVIFWAEEKHDLETLIAGAFENPIEDDDNPDQNVDALRAIYSAIDTGKFAQGDLDTRFYILGLAPNLSRITVRFWEIAKAMDLAKHIKQHFYDLAIIHAPYEQEHLPLAAILTCSASVTTQCDSGSQYYRGQCYDVLPKLALDVLQAILNGTPYPDVLLHGVVRRCAIEQNAKNRKDGKPLPNVTYARAAVLKACLTRLAQHSTQPEKEILYMLDLSNTNPGYLLGRLFAVLERIQMDAAKDEDGKGGEINSTIRDRYYGAASSTPASVFPTLMRLSKYHLAKLADRPAIWYDRLIGEIMDNFNPLDFPPETLTLHDQARFALGYYHQRQAFFAKSTTTSVVTEATDTEIEEKSNEPK